MSGCIDLLPWPAMAASLLAAWLVALIVLNVCLALTNVRGIVKNQRP